MVPKLSRAGPQNGPKMVPKLPPKNGLNSFWVGIRQASSLYLVPSPELGV